MLRRSCVYGWLKYHFGKLCFQELNILLLLWVTTRPLFFIQSKCVTYNASTIVTDSNVKHRWTYECLVAEFFQLSFFLLLCLNKLSGRRNVFFVGQKTLGKIKNNVAMIFFMWHDQPIAGAVNATGVVSAAAKSSGKLWALRSCMTSMPRPARFRMSAHVLMTWPSRSWMDWLKLNPFRLKAMVLTPSAVNQMPTTGQAARKKCRLRLLLKLAYWKIRRPK